MGHTRQLRASSGSRWRRSRLPFPHDRASLSYGGVAVAAIMSGWLASE